MALYKSLTQNRQSRDPKSPPTMHAFEALSHNCTLPFESQCLVLVKLTPLSLFCPKNSALKSVFTTIYIHFGVIVSTYLWHSCRLGQDSNTFLVCLDYVYILMVMAPLLRDQLWRSDKKPSAIFMRQFQAPHFNTNGLKARTHLLLVQLCPLSPLESCRF